MKCPHCGINFHDNWSRDYMKLTGDVRPVDKGQGQFWYFRSAHCPRFEDITIEVARHHDFQHRGEDWSNSIQSARTVDPFRQKCLLQLRKIILRHVMCFLLVQRHLQHLHAAVFNTCFGQTATRTKTSREKSTCCWARLIRRRRFHTSSEKLSIAFAISEISQRIQLMTELHCR